MSNPLYAGLRCHWPRGLRRGSAADLLLGLRVRMGARMSLFCDCCVYCQVEVYAAGRTLVQRRPTDCGVSQCDR